jgi:ArsR family transcriptional regulator
MKQLAAIAGALADPARLRALAALREGELCLCQLITLLELAPSTVSRHMDVLHRAGLVERRKQGRWHYFKLAGREAPPAVRGALRWVLAGIGKEPEAAADAQRVCCLRDQDLKEIAACYRPN